MKTTLTTYTILITLLLSQFSTPKIRIQSPKSLALSIFKHNFGDEKSIGILDYTTALFGNIDYRTKSTYRIVEANSENGCEPITLAEQSEQVLQSKLAIIMKRGDCTFSRKAYNTHHAGGELTIVYDDQDALTPSMIVPVGDKKFLKERIPLILITKNDGLKILETLKNNQKVMISTDFDIPKSTSLPTVDAWISTTNADSYKFMNEFKPYYQMWLWDKINFKPVYRFKSRLNMNDIDSLMNGQRFCYFMGAFCVDDNNGKITKPLELIDEGIRQKCLWHQSSNDLVEIGNYSPKSYMDIVTNSEGLDSARRLKYFLYIDLYKSQCLPNLNKFNFSTNECSKKISNQ